MPLRWRYLMVPKLSLMSVLILARSIQLYVTSLFQGC